MLDRNKLSRTLVWRAIAVWTLSLLMAACVRHLPVVGDEDQAPRGGGSAKGPIAGIGARRSADSAQRSAAAGSSQEQAEEPSESDTPAAGSKAAAPSGSAPKADSEAPKAGSSAGKAGSSAPASPAAAMGGSAAPSTPSMSSTPSTPSGSSSGNSWYCVQSANACSCAEAPTGGATPGDTCTSHPTCCYEFTNTTAYRTCVCVPDGSPECMAYSMNAIPNIKKASSCPL